MELVNLKKSELIHYCKKHNIQNYSNLKKTELMKHIKHSLNKKKGGKPSNTNLNPIIQITRHARSCNNEVKYRINLKETDPSIVNRGIFQTILFAEKNRTKFESNYVYVSCLLRTWITAICLYSKGQTDLTLHISPYLKEKYTWISKKKNLKIEKGNHPVPLKESIPKLLDFLNKIDTFKTKIEKLKINSHKSTITNFKLPNKIILKIEKTDNTTQEINIINNNNIFSIESNEYLTNDQIMNEQNKLYYQTDGNISKFIHWLKDNYKNNNIIENQSWSIWGSSTKKQSNKINKKIHVVAHSNLMKEFLKGLNILNFINKDNFENDCELNNNGYQRCTQSNNNQITKITPENKNQNQTDLEILNKIEQYISGTNCSMIDTTFNYCNNNIKIRKGYSKTDYTGQEYENYSSVLLGKPKYGYDLCDYKYF
jgi:hypothetical protein